MPVAESAIKRKHFAGAVDKSSIDLENSECDFLVTSLSIDREGEVVLPSALVEDLPIYIDGNPIILWNHRRQGDPEEALGTTKSMAQVPDGWLSRFRFDTAINKRAKQVFDQICAGTLRMCSISFIPIAWVDRSSPVEDVEALPPVVRDWFKKGLCKCVYTRVEVIETSITHVGSNRDALKRSMSDDELSNYDDFLRAMIVHHEAALTMCGDYLALPDTDRLLTVDNLAEGIVSAQTAEISTMEELLSDSPVPKHYTKSLETNKEAKMPKTTTEAPVEKAAPAVDKGNIDKSLVKSKAHPAVNDIQARLYAAAGSLEIGSYWEDRQSDDMPSTVRLAAVAKLVMDIGADLTALIPAGEPETEEAEPAVSVVSVTVVSDSMKSDTVNKAAEAAPVAKTETPAPAAETAPPEPPATDLVAFAAQQVDDILAGLLAE